MIKKVKKYKSTRDIKEDYYNQLVRPDGTPISSDEGLLLNLVTHWTKEKPVATSTYEWILKKKFSRLNHIKSIKRKFENISLYVKCKFEQKQIIDGEVHYNKLRIERVADFDAKIAQAKRKEIEQQCPHLKTQMSTAMEQNVHTSSPSTPEVTRDLEPPIKNTIKSTINDNHDYQHNQFLNSKNFSSECVETEKAKIATHEIVENLENELANEKCKATSQAKKQTIEFIEKPESLKGTQSITSHYQSVKVKGKDGKTYKATPLEHYRFDKAILLEAISRSNKKNYTPERIWIIIRNILEKQPKTLVYGGKQGAINYLVKAINGEKDYEYEYKYQPTKEERALSMSEISNMKRIQLEKELVKNEIKWF